MHLLRQKSKRDNLGWTLLKMDLETLATQEILATISNYVWIECTANVNFAIDGIDYVTEIGNTRIVKEM